MQHINYSTFRNTLASAMDRVNENHEPILVTRQSGKPAVVMSLEDFNSYQETAYLMANPANAKELTESINQLENNKGTKRDIIEE